MALLVKKPRANAGELRDSGSTLGSRKSLAGRYGNPLQYSYLEDPMDRGAWWVTVYGVSLKELDGTDLLSL